MARSPAPDSLLNITRFHFSESGQEKHHDQLAIEEPLEIILDFPTTEPPQRKRLTLAITMRTPGNDRELAAGFLFSEGIIRQVSDLLHLSHDLEAANPANTIVASIAPVLNMEPDRLQRHFFTHSACGVCGKTSMQALEMLHQPALTPETPTLTASLLEQLPEWLRTQQQQFAATGGVHSVAAFSSTGKLLALREDVGRHNAMDKLLGTLLFDNSLALLKQAVVLVSGRASFELVQKALMADVPVLASIGAPTSLAYQLADRHQMTLVGFLKADSFNVYTGLHRLQSEPSGKSYNPHESPRQG